MNETDVSDLRPGTTCLPAGRTRRAAVAFAVLGVLLIAGIAVSASLGQFAIPLTGILPSIGRQIGIGTPTDATTVVDGALWNIRFPRLALGLIVGASLGVAGAVMQGVFSNPLAEPAVVGVSAGCAVGACTAIVLDLQFFGVSTVPALAFGAGLLTTLAIYGLSFGSGRAQIVMLVLTGVAVNALAGAGIAFFVFIADTTSREQIIFWQLGSLNGATWSGVAVTAVMACAGIVGAVTMSRRLDILALGERPAQHLGVEVRRLRFWSVVLVALLTAAAVAFAGIIAFVGLVIPHLLRMLVGPMHRLLIPASALGGAVLITVADLAARTVVPFADLPIGMFTALVGAPIFFVLLRRTFR